MLDIAPIMPMMILPVKVENILLYNSFYYNFIREIYLFLNK
jgi:hypothetical protein